MITKNFRIPYGAEIGGTLSLFGALSGQTATFGGSVTASSITANLVSITSSYSNPAFSATSNNNSIFMVPSIAGSSYNPLVGNGDALITTGTSSDVSNLTIAPWASKQIGIRMRSSDADITLASTTVTLAGNTKLFVQGSVGGAGQILYSNGFNSSPYWANIPVTVTNVSTGNGLTGGPITQTGTINVNPGNNQIIANTSGLYLDPSKINIGSLLNFSTDYWVSHSSISVNAGTGLSGGGAINNSVTLNVNPAYIATISSNNSTYLNGQNASYYTDITSRLGYYPVRQFDNSHTINMGWTSGSRLALQIDATVFSSESWPIGINGTSSSTNYVNNVNVGATGFPGFINGGSTSLSSAQWAALPQGQTGMFVSGTQGAPSNYGYFHKLGIRDNSGGWGGIYQAFDGNGIWFGTTLDSYSYPTWRLLLTEINYNNYSPTLTGGNASGTWNINVTGSSGYATTSGTTNSLTLGTTYNCAQLGLGGVNGPGGPLDIQQQNNGTTGGIRMRVNSTSGSAYIQITDTPVNNQYGYVQFTTGGLMLWSGALASSGDVTAFYSDSRLKDVEGNIPNALDKIKTLNGVYYKTNELGKSFGFKEDYRHVGVIAQQVEKVLPEIIAPAPFDRAYNPDGTSFSLSGQDYKTVKYDKMGPLFIEGIKELCLIIDGLKEEIRILKDSK